MNIAHIISKEIVTIAVLFVYQQHMRVTAFEFLLEENIGQKRLQS